MHNNFGILNIIQLTIISIISIIFLDMMQIKLKDNRKKIILNNKLKTRKKIQLFSLLCFFIANSGHRLGVGFDLVFVRISFFIMLILSLIFSKKIKISSIMKWSILFWGFGYLSITWASNVTDSLSLLNLSIQILGVIIAISNIVENKEDVVIVLKLFTIAAMYSLTLLAIRTPFSTYGTERTGAVIGLNPNNFGLLMAIGAMLSLYFYNLENNKFSIYKLVVIVMLIMFSIFSLLSGSKKALLLLVSGFIALKTMSKDKDNIFKSIAAISITIPIMIYFIFNNSTLYSILGSRLESTYLTITKQNSTKTVDKSYVERDFYKKKALELFNDHPIVGVGINNFASYMRDINYSHVAYSHNNYTELLSTLGVIGTILYYSYFISIILKLMKLIKNKDEDYNLNILFIIMIFMFLILDYGMVSYREIINMILLAVIDSYIRTKNKEVIVIENKQ